MSVIPQLSIAYAPLLDVQTDVGAVAFTYALLFGILIFFATVIWVLFNEREHVPFGGRVTDVFLTVGMAAVSLGLAVSFEAKFGWSAFGIIGIVYGVGCTIATLAAWKEGRWMAIGLAALSLFVAAYFGALEQTCARHIYPAGC